LFFECRQSGNHPKEYLAKSGYKLYICTNV